MDAAREQAYRFLLSAAMLHIKQDLDCLFNGFSWLPWRRLRQMRRCRHAADRAVAFHNLATFAVWGFEHFSEERFWLDVKRFARDFPEAEWSNYRGMFEALLRGEAVSVIQPGGGVPTVSQKTDFSA
jgi:hypothetical protein